MKTEKAVKNGWFWLPVAMVALCWGTALCAQEKPSGLLWQNAGIGQEKQIPDTLEPAEKFGDVAEPAPMPKPKQPITLVRIDGKRIPGRLVSLDWEQSLLTLGGGLGGHKSYSLSEIAKIEYRKPGRVNPAWVVVGFLGGALLGDFMARQEEPSSCGDLSCLGEAIAYPAVRATAILTFGCFGAGLGAIISKAVSSKTYTIEFNQ